MDLVSLLFTKFQFCSPEVCNKSHSVKIKMYSWYIYSFQQLLGEKLFSSFSKVLESFPDSGTHSSIFKTSNNSLSCIVCLGQSFHFQILFPDSESHSYLSFPFLKDHYGYIGFMYIIQDNLPMVPLAV